MKDIAQKVGVSIATVSRVLNYDENFAVSDEVKRKIFEAAEEVNYYPKKYRRTKTYKKILIVKAYSEKVELEDTYYLSLRVTIERLLRMNEFFAEIKDDNLSLEELENYHGVIILGNLEEKKLYSFLSKNLNIILVDFSCDNPYVDSVVVNYKLGVKQALEYLLVLGHKKIGIISGRENTGNMDMRELYFRKFLQEKNLLNENYIFYGDFTPHGGYMAAKEMLNLPDKPTAIFVSNDSMAIGCYKAIYELGLKIPEDISIVGFNNTSISRFMTPPLTTVNVSVEEMAETSLYLLKDRLKRNRKIGKKVTISTELLVRESCKEV